MGHLRLPDGRLVAEPAYGRLDVPDGTSAVRGDATRAVIEGEMDRRVVMADTRRIALAELERRRSARFAEQLDAALAAREAG